MPTETTLNNLKIHKVPDYSTWVSNYNETDGIGENDLVIFPPSIIQPALPNQSSNTDGKFLKSVYNSGSPYVTWASVDALPAQSSATNGKFLKGSYDSGTGNSIVEWDSVDAFPNQTSESGKFLQTYNGSVRWANVDALPAQSSNSGKFLTTNGTNASWETISIPSASTTTPSMDGTASYGSGTTWARADHVHPTNTSLAPLASPTFTGIPAAPTASAGTNTTQIATTAFIKTALDNKITYGTSDLTAGTSSLADGVVYLVYE